MEKTVKFKIKADGEKVLVTAGCCVYALTRKEADELFLRVRELLNKMGTANTKSPQRMGNTRMLGTLRTII